MDGTVVCTLGSSLCVDQSGALWSFGSPTFGVLGGGDKKERLSPQEIDWEGSAVSVSCGDHHCFVIDTQGKLWGFGLNDKGQLGMGDLYVFNRVPRHVTTSSQVRLVACGTEHTVYIDYDGQLWSFGDNTTGQLGLGHFRSVHTPQRIEMKNQELSFDTVSCGSNHTVCKSNGLLYVFGDNSDGQLGLGSEYHINEPVLLPCSFFATEISCGSQFTIVLSDVGQVYSFGSNKHGELGLGDKKRRTVPSVIDSLEEIQHISCGREHSMCIDSEDYLWTWGSNAFGQLGFGEQTDTTKPKRLDKKVLAFSKGGHHSIIKDIDNNTWAFGKNDKGQLGTGDKTTKRTPTPLLAGEISSIIAHQSINQKSARK